jgi:hypothetical protein
MLPNPFDPDRVDEPLQAAGFEILLRTVSVGDVELPTGRLVAFDPLVAPETEPFEREVDPGNYPVELVFADMRDETRLAYAVIRFTDRVAVRWQVAWVHGEEDAPSDHGPGGFHVDSAVVCLADERAAGRIIDIENIDGADEFERMMRHALRRGARGGSPYGHAIVELPVTDSGNLPTFEADPGIYTSHWGFDSNGELSMFVVDFGVLDLRFTPFGLRYPQ